MPLCQDQASSVWIGAFFSSDTHRCIASSDSDKSSMDCTAPLHGPCTADWALRAGREIGVDLQLLQESVADMLKHKQLAAPAVSLLRHFPGLVLEFAPLEVMSILVADGQLSTAKAWAADLGPETQVLTKNTKMFLDRHFCFLSSSKLLAGW